LTLSIHHAAPGFFPISEHAMLTPLDTDHPNSLSIPLFEGASNRTFERIWLNCVEPLKNAFCPDFVIIQCGVDGLAGDPCAIWNLGLDIDASGSLGWMVHRALQWNKKTLLLGGGLCICQRDTTNFSQSPWRVCCTLRLNQVVMTQRTRHERGLI
jgi:histone deacetylase 8